MKKLRKSKIIRNLGNTYKEANINKAKVEAQVQWSLGVELNELSKVEKVTFKLFMLRKKKNTNFKQSPLKRTLF